MLPNSESGTQSISYPLAIVTGAAHRIGKALALSLARQGFAIVLHYYNSKDKVAAACEEIGSMGVPVFAIQANLRDEQGIASLFATIDSLLEKPDLRLSTLRVLVNSAAVMEPGDAKTLIANEFDDVIGLNLRAPFLCAQKAFHRMSAGGLIVNISDIAAQKVWASYPIYSISKAGLDSLTKILARSFAPNVRVNGIAPGLVSPSPEFPQEKWNQLIRKLPGQRPASLNELGSALEFLLKNEYITGQTIIVDGGYSLI